MEPAKNEAGKLAIDELPSLLQRNDRLLGLDLGDKTIGLALSDVERRIAKLERGAGRVLRPFAVKDL